METVQVKQLYILLCF